jgi:hypothetical protein
MWGRSADGLLVVFVVEDTDAEHTRLRDDGVEITTRSRASLGRAVLQLSDASGVV